MNKSDLKRLQKRWFEINQPFGKKLGYPDCCIKEFCDQPPELLKISKTKKEDIRRYKAGCIHKEFTGFIPCSSHSKKIISGEITLSSLINNRDNSFLHFPFEAIL